MAAIEEGRDCAAGGYRDNQKSKRVWTANYLHFSIDEPEKPCFSASESCKAQSGRSGAHPDRHLSACLVACFAPLGLSVTRVMLLVLLWWISKLPSRVGLMCRTMPA